MTRHTRNLALFGAIAFLFLLEGIWNLKIGPAGGQQFTIFAGSWNSSLVIMNLCLISAIMAAGGIADTGAASPKPSVRAGEISMSHDLSRGDTDLAYMRVVLTISPATMYFGVSRNMTEPGWI